MSSVINTAETHGLFHIIKLNEYKCFIQLDYIITFLLFIVTKQI